MPIKMKIGLQIAKLGAKLVDSGTDAYKEYEDMSPKGKLGAIIVYRAFKFAGLYPFPDWLKEKLKEDISE